MSTEQHVSPADIERQAVDAYRGKLEAANRAAQRSGDNPDLKAAAWIDPSKIGAKVADFASKIPDYLKVIGPVVPGKAGVVIRILIELYDAVHGDEPAPAAG